MSETTTTTITTIEEAKRLVKEALKTGPAAAVKAALLQYHAVIEEENKHWKEVANIFKVEEPGQLTLG